ncbi:MAG: class I SAM-dependent methyltransferase [Bacteroidota bacterium]
MTEKILITYTTQYRKGGDKFTRVAETMAREKKKEGHSVYCKAIESKRDLLNIFDTFEIEGDQIKEFHFIGHSGMYGPMYGTVQYPEQFSPYEIKQLQVPFTPDAEAYFHCCRSARWFAPFFARTQGVKTYGYHWYTAFSSSKDYYRIDISDDPNKALYCFGCPGKKSHGYLTSLKKYLGKIKSEELKSFDPKQGEIDETYNEVAELYDNTFDDIKVRSDEYNWIIKHLPESTNINLLDVGCGNGALLKELSDRIAHGVGVDVSEKLLQCAKRHNAENEHIKFQKLEGPQLPLPTGECDLVISLLSFRYLDWDPIMPEIVRVLKPEGKLLIIDMVTAPVSFKEWPKLLLSKLRHYTSRFRHPEFYKNLRRLVTDPGWKNMLKYNPIRSQHEMKWYLESRFPGRKVEMINVGYHSRIIAFDSINMQNIKNLKLSYP